MRTVQTNIVQVDLTPSGLEPSSFASMLAAEGIMVNQIHGTTKVRMVTHRGIDHEDIEYTLEVVRKILEQKRVRSLSQTS